MRIRVLLGTIVVASVLACGAKKDEDKARPPESLQREPTPAAAEDKEVTDAMPAVSEEELLKRARALVKKNDAIGAYEALVPAAASGNATVLSELSWLAFLAEKDEEGLKAAERCLSLPDTGKHASCLYNKGRILEAREALPEVIEAYTKSLALRPNKGVARRLAAAQSPLYLELALEATDLDKACEERLFEFWGPDGEDTYQPKSRAEVRAMCKDRIRNSKPVGPARFFTAEVPLPGLYSDVAILYGTLGASYWLWESDTQERTTYDFEFLKTTGQKRQEFHVFLSKGHYDKGETQERYTSLVICDAKRPHCKSIGVETEVSELSFDEDEPESDGEDPAAPLGEYDDGYGFRKLYRFAGGVLTLSGEHHLILPPVPANEDE